jgi:hypothetical protein
MDEAKSEPTAAQATENAGEKPVPVTAESRSVEHRFREAVREWKAATQFTSSTTELVLHPAYQQIIGMGRDVLPLLFSELRTNPDHWFWALKSITGEDPVAPADRGKLRSMALAWLDWAGRHGY